MSVFENKILLITGGTGSFGNAVLNRFLETSGGKENGLQECRSRY